MLNEYMIYIKVRFLFGNGKVQAGAISEVPVYKTRGGHTMTPLVVNHLTYCQKLFKCRGMYVINLKLFLLFIIFKNYKQHTHRL